MMLAWLRRKWEALRRSRELLRQADPRALGELVAEVRELALAATRYLPGPDAAPDEPFEDPFDEPPDEPEAVSPESDARRTAEDRMHDHLRQIRRELEALADAVARPGFRRLPPRERLALRRGLLESRQRLLTAIQSRAEPTRFRQ